MTLLLLAAFFSVADSAQAYYAEKDVRALEALLDRAEGRAEVYLCRYRLYPLTEDEALIEDLPTDLENASARELALLAGLWGYRATQASAFQVVSFGRRSQRLLDRAREKDPLNPYVLLVEGQSLLFRPALFGGSPERALERFRQLRGVLENHAGGSGITRMEAEVWIWHALRTLGTSEAKATRERLLAQDPSPLYREFLMSPPE